MGIQKNYDSIQQSTSTPIIRSVAEQNQGGKTCSGWWLAGPNRMEWPFPDNLFPTTPGTLLLGAGNGPHSNSRVLEEGRRGTNDFLLLEGGAEEVRRQDGKSVGGSNGWLHGP